MTATTDPRRYCCGLTLADGVGHYRGRLRVRLNFPGLGTHVDYFPATPEGVHAANYRIAQLREIRSAGLTPDTAPVPLTLGDAARELVEIRTLGTGLKPTGVAAWHRNTKPWREGEFAAVPVHLLNPGKVAGVIRRRIAEHPKSGRDELIALKAVLRHARAEGCTVPTRLLELETPRKPPARRRKRLLPAELEAFALGAPPAYVRLVLLQGHVGNRIGELLQLHRGDVDLDNARMTIREPKESRRTGAKVIPLLPAEVALLREQLGDLHLAAPSATAHLPSTPIGSQLVWPRPDGSAWPTKDGAVQHAYFARAVWDPTLKAAGRDDLTSHDLRSTAITNMMDQRISLETCATRVGHADGALIRSIYDQGSKLDRAALELHAHAEAMRTAASSTATTEPTAAHREG